MKLPEIKRPPTKFIWLAGILISATILFSSIASKNSGMVDTLKINIQGDDEEHSLVNEKDIKQTIERKYGSGLDGMAIRELDVKAIETLVEENPFVENADVYIDARSKLCITVDQRKPILRIQDKFNSTYYIDKGLFKFPVSRHYTPRTLICTGNIMPFDSASIASGKHILPQLAEVAKAIEKDPLIYSLTEQIYVDSEDNIILVPKIGNQKYILGNADKVEDKLDKLKIYLKMIVPKEGWTRHSYINLKFDGQIVCNKN